MKWYSTPLFFGACLAITVGERMVLAQGTGSALQKVAVKPAEPKEILLNVSPQRLPTPLFRYRLLPISSALNPGNAAPIYLRLDLQTSSEEIQTSTDKAATWLDLPLADFPLEEARKVVSRWSGRLRQIEFGTRRASCEWGYTLLEEKDNPLMILLPDVQAMRGWSRILALKARTEIAAGQIDQAIGTLETGIAFGRHVGQGPFIINRLVGVALTGLMLSLVEESIGQPGAPNLYWALTALPRPLINMREALETERTAIGRMLTGSQLEEIDVTRPQSDPEWAAMLADLHARMIRMEDLGSPKPNPGTPSKLEEYKAIMLPRAREYLRAHEQAATSDDQALVLAIIGLYRELADENFKLGYLPYPAALSLQDKGIEQIKAAKSGPASSFTLALPAIMACLQSEAKLDQRVALLRVVEAVRLHAASHGHVLPDRLDQVEVVPIPVDPMTGQPFEYRREGAAAVLVGANPIPAARLIYRITIRK